MDEVARTSKFLRWLVSIERYLHFTKFMMELFFFLNIYSILYRVYNNIAGPCLIGYESEMGKIFRGNGKIQTIFIYIYSDFVCAT